MKLLMIVGHADDIFIVNFAKWLKRGIDVEVDIIALNETTSKQKDICGLYNKVDILPQHFLFDNIPFVRRYTYDWCNCRHLMKLLEGRHYDIIHCHYIAGLYAGANFLKHHCDKLFFTFWGGEYDRCHYIGSNQFFKKKLRKLINSEVDAIVNGSINTALRWKERDIIPKCYYGSFGSSSLEYLYELIDNKSKTHCKLYYGMPSNKITVQICYSGKSIHQQLEIIEELKKHHDLTSHMHLVVPMTRGANKIFTDSVACALKESGFSYTLLRDRFLSDEEIAKLRYSVDVVLQLSTYDGYSRSVVECMCAGSVFFYGSWLNYHDSFKEDGFKGIAVDSISDAVIKLQDYVVNPSKQDEIAKSNLQIGKGKYLWSECIKDWVAVYNGTAKPLR